MLCPFLKSWRFTSNSKFLSSFISFPHFWNSRLQLDSNWGSIDTIRTKYKRNPTVENYKEPMRLGEKEEGIEWREFLFQISTNCEKEGARENSEIKTAEETKKIGRREARTLTCLWNGRHLADYTNNRSLMNFATPSNLASLPN